MQKNKKVFTSKSLNETNRIATEFVENLLKTCVKPEKKATIIALEGDLGSGKTTFVKSVAQALGIKKTVASPTFVLEKVYKIERFSGFTHLIHIDAYRLENSAEMLALGWETLLKNPNNLIFIEWPERVVELLRDREIRKIWFVFIDEATRKITFYSDFN